MANIKKNKKNNKDQIRPARYVVFYPGYNPTSEEYCENFSSYNTKLDNALSMAYDAARRYNGEIYADLENGQELIPIKQWK